MFIRLQVTHAHLRMPGDLCCPRCGKAGVLQGKGMRPKSRTVLFPIGEVKYFSYGITHPSCSIKGKGEWA